MRGHTHTHTHTISKCFSWFRQRKRAFRVVCKKARVITAFIDVEGNKLVKAQSATSNRVNICADALQMHVNAYVLTWSIDVITRMQQKIFRI